MEAIGCVLMFLGLLASLATPEHIVPNALSLGLSVYLWICVYSLFKFIQSEDYNQQMAYNPGMQKV